MTIPEWDELEARAQRSSETRPHMAARRKAKRRNKVVAICLISALIFIPLAVAGLLAFLFYSSYSGNVHVADGQVFPTSRPPASTDGSENILLLGSDTRAVLGDIDTGSATAQRSDTMLLVHLAADRRSVQVVSLMRDLWVPIPGHGQAKINAAFSWGGLPLTIQTVETLLGARIDHVAVMDFAGFADMSTSLGGVDVVSPKAFASKNQPGFTYTAGVNHLEGQRALAFVRERYSFATGDYQRVKNQQAFLQGMISKLTTGGFPDIGRLNAFVAATSKFVTVDKGFDFASIVSLGYSLRNVRSADVTFATLPTLGTGRSPDGQSIVLVDPTRVAGVAAALKADTLGSYLATQNGAGR